MIEINHGSLLLLYHHHHYHHDHHHHQYYRIPALSWLSAGQLDGMNDSVLTQVSSYVPPVACLSLLLFLFLSSRAIDLDSINIRIITITTIVISSDIINMSLQWMNTGKTSTLRAIDLDSSDNITEDMLGKFLDRWR